MKIFIYDENRVLMRTVGTPDIMQHEDNATLVFMSVAGIDETNFQNYLAQFAATIGTSHPTDIITDFGTYTLDGIEYKGWRYFVSSKFTQVSGALNANLVLSSNGATLISQTVTLNVNPSASGVTWFQNITQAQWGQLLAYCIGLRNPNLGELSDEDGLDPYCNAGQAGAYQYLGDDGFSHLLFVSYDEDNDRVYQTDYYNGNGALLCRQRYTAEGDEDGWTNWTQYANAGAMSVNTANFANLPNTANTVQKAIEALDESLPNNIVLAEKFHINMAGDDLIEDYGYTFTLLGNSVYAIGFPAGKDISDYLYDMGGAKYTPTPYENRNQFMILDRMGQMWMVSYDSINDYYTVGPFTSFVLYESFKNLVDGLGESMTTKSLLVKNSSITNLRANGTQFIANEGGNTHLINSTEHTFTDKGNTYKFPYPSGTTQTDYEKKLATVGMINDLLDLADGRFGADFDMSLDADYVLAITLRDYDGNILRTRTVDFPAEMAMVNASYDNATKDLTFTLQNGNTVTVPLDDIISGLASEAYVTNAISAALADYVTASALNTALASYVTSASLATTLADYVTTVALNTALSSYATLSYANSTFAPIGASYTKQESDAKYALGTDLASTNARVSALETKTAKQESDIQYLYRQVIGGGDLVTETDSRVSLTSQTFPLTISPKALLDYVGGMCQKVNQLLPTSAFASTSEQLGVTKTNNGDGSFTMSGTADGGTAYLYFLSNTRTLIQSHKYCVFALGNFNKVANMRIRAKTEPDGENSYFNPNTIVTGYVSFDQIFFSVPDGETASGSVFLTLVDISDAYPTNTPTTTSDARIQWLMSYLSEHPEYNAGSILTAPVTKVVSKGLNLWDEQTEVGYIDASGNLVVSATNIRSKNYTEVIPNTKYYAKISATGNVMVVYYDSGFNFVGSKTIYKANAGTVSDYNAFTAPNNCAYVKLAFENSYGTTYNHDVCVNVFNASMNGTYMPYRAPIEYAVPAEVRALEGYGYGLSDTLYNHIDFDGKSYVKVMVRVDLGSLNWNYNANWNGGGGFYITTAIEGMKIPAQSNVPNAICGKYDVVTRLDLYNDPTLKGLCIPPDGLISVRDSAYSDAATFKAAMSGVYLYYEVAAPTETDVSEYIDSDVIEVSAGGHLEFVNEDDLGVPYSTTYQCEPENQGEGE